MAFLYIYCFLEIYLFKIIQFSFKGLDKLLNMFGKIYYILFFFKQDVRDKTRTFFLGSGGFLLIFIIYLVLFSFVQFPGLDCLKPQILFYLNIRPGCIKVFVRGGRRYALRIKCAAVKIFLLQAKPIHLFYDSCKNLLFLPFICILISLAFGAPFSIV